MTISFKNRYIFFAVATIWDQLNYKFKAKVNELVVANPDDDFVQVIDVPESTLVQIYGSNAKLSQGIAKYMNVEMQAALVPQLQTAANLSAVQSGQENPNEAMRILMACQEIDTVNAEYREALIMQGKNQILA